VRGEKELVRITSQAYAPDEGCVVVACALHVLTSNSSTVLRLRCACVSASDVSSCSASDRTARTNEVTADFVAFFPFFSVSLSGDEGPSSWDRWRFKDFKNAWQCMGWRILGTRREEQSNGIEKEGR
jgi:hypothetical protein